MCEFEKNRFYKIGKELIPLDKPIYSESFITLALLDDDYANTFFQDPACPIHFHGLNSTSFMTRLEEYDDCVGCFFHIPIDQNPIKDYADISIYFNNRFMLLILHNEKANEILNEIQLKHVYKTLTMEKLLYDICFSFVHEDLFRLESFERQLTEMENLFLSNTKTNIDIKSLLQFRKELLYQHNYYVNFLDLALSLTEDENSYFTDVTCLRHLTDKLDRLYDYTNMLREYSTQIQEMYQAHLDMYQNRTMKLLTGVATIFLPLSLLTSWYGMNFTFMPELQWYYSYPIFIAITLAIITTCIWLFQKLDFF